MPALSFGTIRVGGCYEFNRHYASASASASGSGATAGSMAYVPAIVLSKRLVAGQTAGSAGSLQQRQQLTQHHGEQGRSAERRRSIEGIEDRLRERRRQQQQQPSDGESDTAFLLTLSYPGVVTAGGFREPC